MAVSCGVLPLRQVKKILLNTIVATPEPRLFNDVLKREQFFGKSGSLNR